MQIAALGHGLEEESQPSAIVNDSVEVRRGLGLDRQAGRRRRGLSGGGDQQPARDGERHEVSKTFLGRRHHPPP
jgi:hypothetical protein